MSTTTLNLRDHTAAADGGWLAGVLRALTHRPLLPRVIREAAQARALAQDWAHSDPRMAAELQVAADRHEQELDA